LNSKSLKLWKLTIVSFVLASPLKRGRQDIGPINTFCVIMKKPGKHAVRQLLWSMEKCEQIPIGTSTRCIGTIAICFVSAMTIGIIAKNVVRLFRDYETIVEKDF